MCAYFVLHINVAMVVNNTLYILFHKVLYSGIAQSDLNNFCVALPISTQFNLERILDY